MKLYLAVFASPHVAPGCIARRPLHPPCIREMATYAGRPVIPRPKMKPINHECPLCGAPASYYLLPGPLRDYYNCPSCTKFGISVTAQRKLRREGHPYRASLAAQARRVTQHSDDHVLDIWWRTTPGDQGITADRVAKAGYCLERRPAESAAEQTG